MSTHQSPRGIKALTDHTHTIYFQLSCWWWRLLLSFWVPLRIVWNLWGDILKLPQSSASHIPQVIDSTKNHTIFSPFETEHKTPFRTPKNIKLRQPKDKTFTTLWCESSPAESMIALLAFLLARSQARPVNCQYGSVSTVQRKQDYEWKTKECILYYAFSYQTSLSPPSSRLGIRLEYICYMKIGGNFPSAFHLVLLLNDWLAT